MTEIVDAIRQWQGAWPRETVLLTDNGAADFGQEFTDTVEAYEPLITVKHGVKNRPNSQGAVESSNRTVRGVLRRLLQSRYVRGWQTRRRLRLPCTDCGCTLANCVCATGTKHARKRNLVVTWRGKHTKLRLTETFTRIKAIRFSVKRKQEEGALEIQRHFRGWQTRRQLCQDCSMDVC